MELQAKRAELQRDLDAAGEDTEDEDEDDDMDTEQPPLSTEALLDLISKVPAEHMQRVADELARMATEQGEAGWGTAGMPGNRRGRSRSPSRDQPTGPAAKALRTIGVSRTTVAEIPSTMGGQLNHTS